MKKIDIVNSHAPAYLCSHIFENVRPILYVCREEGDWQFLCGYEHDADEIPHVVGLGHMFKRDPSLFNIADLENDWEAERESSADEWKLNPLK